MRKNYILLLEIFIWMFMLGGLSLLGIDIINGYFANRTSYQVAFKDIDGVTVGAPVRVMGIQAGHVTAVIPKREHVLLAFVITNPDIKIPKGSVITVQFTGLAGSKSIEVIPSNDRIKSGQFVEIIEPVRVSSLMDIQTKMSESILDCTDSILDIFGHNPPENIKISIKFVKVASETAINSVDDVNYTLKSVNANMDKGAKILNDYLAQNDKDISFYNDFIINNNYEIKDAFVNFTSTVENLPEAFSSNSGYVNFVAQNIKNLNHNVIELRNKTLNYSSDPNVLIQELNRQINQPITILNYFSSELDNNFNKENVDKAHKLIKSLNYKTEKLEKSL